MTKTQVDRLGDRLREGLPTPADLRLLDDYRQSFAVPYQEVLDTLTTVFLLKPTGRQAKSTASIVAKLRRERVRLSQMQDIAGMRVIVVDVQAQEAALRDLTSFHHGATVIDRRVATSHGYRAVHVVMTVASLPVEVQIRTELQHLWAELSEKLADRYGEGLKYGEGDPSMRSWLGMASLLVASIEIEESGSMGFQAIESRLKVRQILTDLRRRLVGLGE